MYLTKRCIFCSQGCIRKNKCEENEGGGKSVYWNQWNVKMVVWHTWGSRVNFLLWSLVPSKAKKRPPAFPNCHTYSVSWAQLPNLAAKALPSYFRFFCQTRSFLVFWHHFDELKLLYYLELISSLESWSCGSGRRSPWKNAECKVKRKNEIWYFNWSLTECLALWLQANFLSDGFLSL